MSEPTQPIQSKIPSEIKFEKYAKPVTIKELAVNNLYDAADLAFNSAKGDFEQRTLVSEIITRQAFDISQDNPNGIFSTKNSNKFEAALTAKTPAELKAVVVSAVVPRLEKTRNFNILTPENAELCKIIIGRAICTAIDQRAEALKAQKTAENAAPAPKTATDLQHPAPAAASSSGRFANN